MLLGDVEIEYCLEMGLVVLWLKCFFFILALCAAHNQCEIEYCFQRNGLSIMEDIVMWYDSCFLQFLLGFIMVEGSTCLSNG